jgi:CheY-like chemotaxis protein
MAPDTSAPYAIAVDDNALILMQIGDILEDAGFRYDEARDGAEAVALLERKAREVTLLFSDVEMPGMTGFELACHVDRHWPWIEIVVCSGRITPKPGDMPAKATFIAKPFSAEMVHSHLRRTLPDGKKPTRLLRA